MLNGIPIFLGALPKARRCSLLGPNRRVKIASANPTTPRPIQKERFHDLIVPIYAPPRVKYSSSSTSPNHMNIQNRNIVTIEVIPDNPTRGLWTDTRSLKQPISYLKWFRWKIPVI